MISIETQTSQNIPGNSAERKKYEWKTNHSSMETLTTTKKKKKKEWWRQAMKMQYILLEEWKNNMKMNRFSSTYHQFGLTIPTEKRNMYMKRSKPADKFFYTDIKFRTSRMSCELSDPSKTITLLLFEWSEFTWDSFKKI